MLLRGKYSLQNQEELASKKQTKQKQKNTKYVTAEEDSALEMFTVLTVTSEDTDLSQAKFSFNDVDLEMEIDNGARKNVISEITYKRQFSHLPLQRAKVKLRAYNGGCIPVLGQITVTVGYQDQTAVLPLLVVKGRGATLCGRDWLKQLSLNWAEIKHSSEPKCSLGRCSENILRLFSDTQGH